MSWLRTIGHGRRIKSSPMNTRQRAIECELLRMGQCEARCCTCTVLSSLACRRVTIDERVALVTFQQVAAAASAGMAAM